MRLALGSDHRGFILKQALIQYVRNSGYCYYDFGSFDRESVDYPEYALYVAREVGSGHYDLGILICGTGIGMCIAANKIKSVRAAVCHNVFEAQRSRKHNNANVLCLGGDTTDREEAIDIVNTFITTEFEGGKHQRRLDKITEAES